jgi:hypothetical protein
MNIDNMHSLIIEKIYDIVFNAKNNTKDENKNLCLVSKTSYNLIKGNDKNINKIILNSKIQKSYNLLKNNIKRFKLIELYKLKFGTCVIWYIMNIFQDNIFLTDECIGNNIVNNILHDKKINNILFKRFFIICHFNINFKAKYNKKKQNNVFPNKSKFYQEKINKIMDILQINKQIKVETIKDYILFLENLSTKELFYLCYVHRNKQGFYNFQFLKI